MFCFPWGHHLNRVCQNMASKMRTCCQNKLCTCQNMTSTSPVIFGERSMKGRTEWNQLEAVTSCCLFNWVHLIHKVNSFEVPEFILRTKCLTEREVSMISARIVHNIVYTIFYLCFLEYFFFTCWHCIFFN